MHTGKQFLTAPRPVTLDAADTYVSFVTPSWAANWHPSASNHVLNTMLRRILAAALGLSHLALFCLVFNPSYWVTRTAGGAAGFSGSNKPKEKMAVAEAIETYCFPSTA